MMRFGLSENIWWRSAFQSADATFAILSVFEGRHIQEIDAAIESLRNVLAIGDDFDKVKKRQQQQKQKSEKCISIQADMNDVNDAVGFQHAIELSLVELNISQYNAEEKISNTGPTESQRHSNHKSIMESNLHKDKPQNKQTSEYYHVNTPRPWRINAEFGYTENQFEQDTKRAIELPLEDEIKKNKDPGNMINDTTTTLAEQDDLFPMSEPRTSSERSSNQLLKQGEPVKIATSDANHPNRNSYDPLFESSEPLPNDGHHAFELHTTCNDTLGNETTESKTKSPKSILADSMLPPISVPVPVRHNAVTIAQGQMCFNTPQPIKFTPGDDDDKIIDTVSTPSSAISSPTIATKAIAGFEGKPSKIKVFKDLGVILGDQNKVACEAICGNIFDPADKKWIQGTGIEIADWEREKTKKGAEITRSSWPPPQGNTIPCLIDRGASIGDDLISIDSDEAEDNWTKQEAMPDTMVIKLKHFPIRESKGPRATCPYNDGKTESNEEESDENDV